MSLSLSLGHGPCGSEKNSDVCTQREIDTHSRCPRNYASYLRRRNHEPIPGTEVQRPQVVNEDHTSTRWIRNTLACTCFHAHHTVCQYNSSIIFRNIPYYCDWLLRFALDNICCRTNKPQVENAACIGEYRPSKVIELTPCVFRYCFIIWMARTATRAHYKLRRDALAL